MKLIGKFHDLHHVQKLTLVFVHTLDLDIENGIRVNADARAFIRIVRKPLLVAPLDLSDLRKNRGIVAEFFQSRKMQRTFAVIGSDQLVEKRAERGVREIQPAAMNDAVGNIGKLPRCHFVEVVEDGFFQYLAVKF